MTTNEVEDERAIGCLLEDIIEKSSSNLDPSSTVKGLEETHITATATTNEVIYKGDDRLDDDILAITNENELDKEIIDVLDGILSQKENVIDDSPFMTNGIDHDDDEDDDPISDHIEEDLDYSEEADSLMPTYNITDRTNICDLDTDQLSDNIDILKHVLPKTYEQHRITAGNDVLANDTDEDNFVVEKIIAKKLDDKGCAAYLVKWEGYPSAKNSWEPIQFLTNCAEKMADFELASAIKLARLVKSKAPKQMNTNSKYKTFQVMDVMGMTKIENEKYYLVSLINSTQKKFIRASVAKRVMPGKVIDFYLKNIKWKTKSGVHNSM